MQSGSFRTDWEYDFKTTTTKLFIQDTWKVSEALSVNFGFASLKVKNEGATVFARTPALNKNGTIEAEENFLPQAGARFALTMMCRTPTEFAAIVAISGSLPDSLRDDATRCVSSSAGGGAVAAPLRHLVLSGGSLEPRAMAATDRLFATLSAQASPTWRVHRTDATGLEHTGRGDEHVLTAVQAHDGQRDLVVADEDHRAAHAIEGEFGDGEGNGMADLGEVERAVDALDAHLAVQLGGQGLRLGIEKDVAGDFTEAVLVDCSRHGMPSMSWAKRGRHERNASRVSPFGREGASTR